MSAYDRGKLVELFGNDPATVAVIEREFFDTACEVAREIAEAVERAAKAHDLGLVRGLHDRFCGEVLRVAEQAGLPIDQV